MDFIKSLILNHKNILFSLIVAILSLSLFFQSISIAQDEPTLMDIAEDKPTVDNSNRSDSIEKDSGKKQAVSDIKKVHTIDKFNRDTPATTVKGFLSAVSSLNVRLVC